MTVLGIFVIDISINVLVGWAFAIAASTFCPLLLLGIWWRRLTWIGAICGLLLGGVTTSAAVVATIFGVGATGWPAVLLGEPAIWAVPLAFVTMIGVSLATPRALPHDVTQKLLALHLPERVRLPTPHWMDVHDSSPELAAVLRSSKPSKVKAGVTRGPDQGVARRAGGPTARRRRHHDLGRLAGVDVGAHDLHVAPTVGPFTAELEGVTGIEVPELGGVDAMGGRVLTVQEEVEMALPSGGHRPLPRPPRCGGTTRPRDAGRGRARQ